MMVEQIVEKYYPRPTIPIVLGIAIVLWTTVYIVFQLVESLSSTELIGILIACAFGFLILGIFGLRKRSLVFCEKGSLFLVITSMLLGCGLCCYNALNYQKTLQYCTEQSPNTLIVDVVSDGSESDYGFSTKGEGLLGDKKVLLKLSFYDSANCHQSICSYGKRIKISGHYYAPSENNTNYFFQNGIHGTFSVSEVETIDSEKALNFLFVVRDEVSRYLDTVTTGEESIFLKALLIGDRSELFSSDLYQSIRVDGLAHFVAVSGAHLVIFTAGLGLILRKLRISKRLSSLLLIFSCVFYLVFSGFSVSCIRATAMSVCSYLSIYSNRRSHGLSALGVLIICFIALNPTVCFSLSFLLSVSAVLGISVFQPLFKNWASQFGFRNDGFLVESIVLTLSASVFTFGLSVSQFGQLSTISLLANIFATLLIPYVLGFGLVACLVGIMFPIPVFGATLNYLAGLVCLGINALASVPYASIPFFIESFLINGVTIVLAISFWYFWPRVSKKLIITTLEICILGVALCVVSIYPVQNGTRLAMLDVGQGDAFLLQSKGCSVLVDTGNQDIQLIKGLAKAKTTHLNAVIISHPDDDHCGSLEALRGVVQIDHVYLLEGLKDIANTKVYDLVKAASKVSKEKKPEEVHMGSILTVGDFKISVIGPEKLTSDGANQDSICLCVRSDVNHDGVYENTALLVGDAENNELEKMISSMEINKVEILKVGHHGSKNALSKETLEVLKPQFSLISVGEKNRYGHPSRQTLELLKDSGTKVLRTDISGSLVCNFLPDGISVDSLR